MDGGALHTEYRVRCQNYETALKKMRQELLDARSEAMKLSKMATEDRKKCIGLQSEVMRAAACYSELCTKSENERLVALKEKEDYDRQIKVLKELNNKLEERACRAEGEAARAIAEHRENIMKWQLERCQLAVQAVVRVHRRHRLQSMKHGLYRWRQSAAFERLREEFAQQQAELQASLLAEYEEELLRIKTENSKTVLNLTNTLDRTGASRDRLAEERPALVAAARGYGPVGVMLRWKVEILKARVDAEGAKALSIQERASSLEDELNRVRMSFANLCLRSLMPRLLRQAVRNRFAHWAAYMRHFARLAHEEEVAEGWEAAEKLASNIRRIRQAASNLVIVSIVLYSCMIFSH